MLNQLSPIGPTERTHRSLWLQEALEKGHPLSAAPLDVSTTADVTVVGGGYTGLWTALHLKEASPDLDVVVLEGDVCGAGASGRSGGFAMTWWAKYGALKGICGREDALWWCRQAEQSVVEIGRFATEHDIPADFVASGWLWVATSQAQMNSWRPTVEEVEAEGVDHVFERLTPDQARARTGSEAVIGGVLERTTATLHPGHLARGLRRVALERGVRIHERTRVTGIAGKATPEVHTQGGALVRADAVVVALNAWALGLPEFRALRRDVLPLSSDMIATERIPDRLDALGYTGREGVTDARMLVHYYQRTRDGRIALGRGGGGLGFGGRFGEDFHYHRHRAAGVAQSLRRLYPPLAGVEVTHAWGGPIDRSVSGLPFFGRLPHRPQVFYGLGFSGNGVGPSHLAGRVLSSLALGRRDRCTETALAQGPPRNGRFPPEPVRLVGGRLVRAAVARKERQEDRGAKVGRLTAALAAKAPSGLFMVADESDRHADGGERKTAGRTI